MSTATPNLRELLERRIWAFLNRTGIPHTRMAEEATGDKKIIWRLRRGENLTLKTIERLEAYMDNYTPDA